MRHFFASWCINRKVDGGRELPLKNVQQLLGHASVVITLDTYSHLFPNQDDRVELTAAEAALWAPRTEFESYMPSHAVGFLWALRNNRRPSRLAGRLQPGHRTRQRRRVVRSMHPTHSAVGEWAGHGAARETNWPSPPAARRLLLRSRFPKWQEGRHPHCHFRGLLRLHSRYGPPDRSGAWPASRVRRMLGRIGFRQ
jgi:hypothetical protein